MKATVLFKQIKDEIIANLKTAKTEIKVAIAWLTDEDIIRVLTQQKAAGIDVQIVISNSQENFKNNAKFKEFLRIGGELYIATSPFMHHKFCIIDQFTIINGSYNWSYPARSNEENILVISLDKGLPEDCSFLEKFIVKYRYLHSKCSTQIFDLRMLDAFAINSKNFGLLLSQLDQKEIMLRQEFENDVNASIDESVRVKIQVNAATLRDRMKLDGGGVEFVRRILHDEISSGEMKPGFKKLEEQIPNRVDLSLEFLVSRPKYEGLFNENERNFCKKLMAKYNY